MASPLERRHWPSAFSLTRDETHWSVRFMAMGCPCEALIEPVERQRAHDIATAVSNCAWRIEAKYSRYRNDGVMHAINTSAGRPVSVDDETARLLDYAATLTRLSEGRFDITSGVLRRAWTFDGSDRIPAEERIDPLLKLVGWSKVSWSPPTLSLLPGMELDFGGIGKEYAVDAAVDVADRIAPGVSCLVNFGGDVAVRNPRSDGAPWRVGIEAAQTGGPTARILPLQRGALATSGDTRRFLLRDGVRYSHILDARTGWPVRHAPRAVTVVADTCSQAGALTTLAMLAGDGARRFLEDSGQPFWLQ